MYLYITGVRVMGEYSTVGGPASIVQRLPLRKWGGNLPGTLIVSFLNRPYTRNAP